MQDKTPRAAILANSVELLQAVERLLHSERFIRDALANGPDKEQGQSALTALTELHVLAKQSREA